MKAKFSKLRKLFGDESALGTVGCMAGLPIGGAASCILGGLLTLILGGAAGLTSIVPVVCGSSVANCIPFGGCVFGNCATCFPIAWCIDACEVFSCTSLGGALGGALGGVSLGGIGGIISGIGGTIVGILGDIGGILLAIASGGGGAAGMTSGISGVTSFFG